MHISVLLIQQQHCTHVAKSVSQEVGCLHNRSLAITGVWHSPEFALGKDVTQKFHTNTHSNILSHSFFGLVVEQIVQSLHVMLKSIAKYGPACDKQEEKVCFDVLERHVVKLLRVHCKAQRRVLLFTHRVFS